MDAIKKSNICKTVENFHINEAIAKTHKPLAGDVAIFEVLSLGCTTAIQDFEGRHCHIFEGDKVMLAFGNRYASNQFEGYVPDAPAEEYDLISKGGVAGIVASMYYSLELKGPTKLRLIGYATNPDGCVINTVYYHRKSIKFDPNKIRGFKTLLSVGSSMDSGKTTTAAYLSRSLKKSGYKVAYIKLTGTVFNKDRMLVFDCGADAVADFSELGFPSTYLCSLEELMDIYEALLTDVARCNPDYVIIEIADGIYQRETAMLLNHPAFNKTINHVILSCCDSMAVTTGVQVLEKKFGSRLFALSGFFTASPLMMAEVESRNSLPVLTLEKMLTENITPYLTPQTLHVAV